MTAQSNQSITATTPDEATRAVLIRSRPAQAGAGTTTWVFCQRALLKLKHGPDQLFDAIGLPIILTLMFTYLLGGALAGSPTAYIQQLTPGILVMTLTFMTVTTGLNLSTDLAKGVSDRFRSMPIWQPGTIIGAMAGDIVRYLVASVVVIGLGLALGFRPAGGVVGVLLSFVVMIVFVYSLTWLWISLGLGLRAPEAMLNISMMILMPLSFLSNIFVNPDTMPGWLEAFVTVNPLTQVVTAVRGLMSDTVTGSQLLWVLVGCVLVTAVFAPLALRKYRTRQ
ncbi:ABC transporter [Actinosynnema sp. ALI-1.44]|uniref:ABC transporter permease n=1 Tax=Actinosynnema sp. ALI-1.44 TaxID=1933779 RepID=UPI00097CBC99|nr:ABC transporter permease [Actinosynnema sp. ALI-1.44]ONI76364.1 ABC transporter [Actinosynnema sp. ALI-1.44]